jgi:hypothetical protein
MPQMAKHSLTYYLRILIELYGRLSLPVAEYGVGCVVFHKVGTRPLLRRRFVTDFSKERLLHGDPAFCRVRTEEVEGPTELWRKNRQTLFSCFRSFHIATKRHMLSNPPCDDVFDIILHHSLVMSHYACDASPKRAETGRH